MSKTIMITGATEGVGRATAIALATRGHTLVLHGRNRERLASALSDCRAAGAHADSRTHVADYASLDSVANLARDVDKSPRLDVLINNAAAMYSSRVSTADGYEGNFGVNYLAPALLTMLLLPKLNSHPGARIVNLSSVGYKSAKPMWDDLQATKSYGMQPAYFVSKLFNLYFTQSLAQRLPATTTANAVHPGGVQTKLARDFKGPMKWTFSLMMPLFFITPEAGAETPVFLAEDPSVAQVTGGYFVKKKQEKLTPIGDNREARERLWVLTRDLLRDRLPSGTM
jgi:NAD(P)-dependent dehydrogenase (short-subunit alcohol dehydrogenase family)